MKDISQKQVLNALALARRGLSLGRAMRSELTDYKARLSVFEDHSALSRVYQELLVSQQQYHEACTVSEQHKAQILKVPSIALSQAFDSPLFTAQTTRTHFVTYSLMDATLYIWVKSPDRDLFFKEAPCPDLNSLIDQCRLALVGEGNRGFEATPTEETIDVPPADQSHQPLTELRQYLIPEELEALLHTNDDSIVFCVSGVLALVPFGALRREDRYLVDQHSISTTPSLSFLCHAYDQDSQPIQAAFLALANPSRTAQGELPSSEDEAVEIGQNYISQTLLIGDNATHSNLREALSKQPSIVHLATHGINYNRDGHDPWALPGGLVCCDDQLLTSEEISQLALPHTQLAVLSACRSHAGVVKGLKKGGIPQDCATGPSLAFLIAGATRTVATLWPVADGPTTELMILFHQELTATIQPQHFQIKPFDVSIALQKAILRLRTEMPSYDNPFFWAGFVISGLP